MVAVCAVLNPLKGRDKSLVDLGAAEGHFGASLVAVGASGRSIVFEIDTQRELELVELAQARGLADCVSIHAEVTGNVRDLVTARGGSLRV